MRVTECGSFVPAFCISFNENITHANILNGGRRGKLLLARAVLLQSVTIRRLTGNDILAAISIIIIVQLGPSFKSKSKVWTKAEL